MKLRNYEKRSGILFLIIMFFIAVLVLILYTIFYKIVDFYLIRGVVFRDDLVEIIASGSEMKILQQNGFVYIDGKKYKYYINNVMEDALRKDGKYYDVVYLECNLVDEKENDIVDLVFMEKKVRLLDIFKLIWEGD